MVIFPQSEATALRYRFLSSEEDLAKIAGDWKLLTLRVSSALPYQTYAWFKAWQCTFGENKNVGVLVWYHGSDLVGLMPLMILSVRRSPSLFVRFDYTPEDQAFLRANSLFRFLHVHQITPPMNLESCNLRGDLLATQEYETQCIRMIFMGLSSIPGWNTALLPCAVTQMGQSMEAMQTSGLMGFVRRSDRAFYSLKTLPWPEFLQKCSKNFKKNMRKILDQTSQRKDLQCQNFYGAHQAESALQSLYAIAERSWKARGRVGEEIHLPLTHRTRSFFYHLCTHSSSEITPYILILSVGREPRAGMLYLRTNQCLFGCQMFYDPAIANLSPGHLMMKEAITWAWEQGIQTIDLNGASLFNQMYADHSVMYHQMLIFRKEPYSRLLYTLSHWLSSGSILAMNGENER